MSNIINSCSADDIVEVSEISVFREIERLRNNCATYPGELPVKLLKEYSPFLAKPMASIINQCFSEQSFPKLWKAAYVRVIPKVKAPQSCDQLRPISITPNLAKVAEGFIHRALLQQIAPSIDTYQYGCIRGSSTAIYLVRMYHLIVEWLDSPNSVIDLLLADYRKAFDLIEHLIALKNLKEMGAGKNLLLLVRDFLRGRRQSVYPLFADVIRSEWTELTCGCPQGTKLAALLFLAVINKILAEFEERFKFVDDLSSLLKYIVENAVAKQQFEPTLFSDFVNQCKSNSLQLNEQKSKVLRFNPLKRDITIPDVPFPTVSSATILGVTFTSDCSFKLHVDNIVRKGHYSIQSLTSMRRLGFSDRQLLLAYTTYIRPILEYCCPVWGPQAQNTAYMSEELEDVQKRATKIILGPRYESYEHALVVMSLPTLFARRHDLIMRFGKSLMSNEKHRSILPPTAPTPKLTRHQNRLQPVKCRTNRFANSFVPYFVSVLNK